MRALIVSDIHANIDVLLALEAEMRASSETFDMVLALGDFVDYGATPAEVIGWARANVHYSVRGNHDHAMATGADCLSSPSFIALSIATREFFRPRLSEADIEYLRALPFRKTLSIEGRRFEMVHATPRSPLFEYLRAAADESVWREALAYCADRVDFVLLGHTHLPFTRRIGRTLVINPGSLGQPKDGDPRGCYAVLDNDGVELRRLAYDVEKAISRLRELDLEPSHIEQLAAVLRCARGAANLE